MQVILLEKVRNLGNLGETVSVKPGYGRNFLIPYGKAVSATRDNVKKFELRRAELESLAKEKLERATEKAAKLEALVISIAMRASDEGKLYGSVSTLEISKALKEQGIELSRSDVSLPNGVIRHIGEYPVAVQLHSDVIASIIVRVIAE